MGSLGSLSGRDLAREKDEKRGPNYFFYLFNKSIPRKHSFLSLEKNVAHTKDIGRSSAASLGYQQN